MKWLLIPVIIIVIVSIAFSGSLVQGQIRKPVLPQMEDTTAHAPANTLPENKKITEKEQLANGVNDDTATSIRGIITEEDGIEYLVKDGVKTRLLKGDYFPSTICRNQLIDVSIDVTLDIDVLHPECYSQGSWYICNGIWEDDAWPLPDDEVVTECGSFPHSPGYSQIHIQYTFHNINLTPKIEGDPGDNGEFYIKTSGVCPVDFTSQSENVGICGEPLVPPSYVSPPDGATDQTQPVYLDWTSVSGANGYGVQVDNNSSFSSPEINTTTGNSYLYASGLADGTKYYWRVRTHSSCCEFGSWSPSGRDFTTSCPLPGTPSCVSPPDGATDQTQPVYLDWTSIPEVYYYEIQVDNNSNFSSPEIIDHPANSYYNASGLADGTTYYWRVCALNICGWGSCSPSGRDFTTSCPLPGTPSCVSPPDGATDQTQPVYLDWNSVSGANYYQIQVDNNLNFDSPEIDQQPSSSYYNASGLADGTRYYWRVRAHNSCGWGDWSPYYRDFTTVTTDVGEEKEDKPTAFALYQSYPNPFNPICRVDYTIQHECHVSLNIYNVRGQRIRVLVEQNEDVGFKSVIWDGKDDQGQDASSGIYFYRIQAGDFAESKKMVLLR